MKIAFKILPEFSSENNNHLLAEVGGDGIALLWYSRQPLKIEGLCIYQSPKSCTEETVAEALQKILASENLPPYLSCNIYYNFKESLIIPSEFYKQSNNTHLLNCIYGDMPGSVYFSEPVNTINATNIYRVPEAVHQALTNRFFGANNFHSNSKLIADAKDKSIYCIVYNSCIKVILFKEGMLQLVQLYDYNTPSDVAYHLLSICTQHNLSPALITLTLSGFVDKQSNLYEELHRYFLHINMDELPQGIEVTQQIRSYPDHFFSFLIAMVK